MESNPIDIGIDPSRIPTHVAIIMDGNRRWAVEHDLKYIEGHKEALKRIEELVDFSARIGVKHLTLWAWSTKNWKRSQDFIDDILFLFRENLHPDGIFKRAVEKGAELHHIGCLDRFPKDIQEKVVEFLKTKPKEKQIDLNLAVGYEGRDEIVRAVQKIIKVGLKAEEITQELISQNLDTASQPDVDFLIRTGGEKRTSGYLIWQAADAEYYFTDTLMPNFTVEEYTKALIDYSKRERRMGGDSKKY